MKLRSFLLVPACAYGIAGSGISQAQSQTSDGSQAQPSAGSGIEEIVVTARRREESLQSVPVSVAAFSGAALEQRGVNELRDLSLTTPGLNFTSSGSKQNVNITMRGQSKSVVGVGLPSVITYLNEVPLPAYGSSLPSFDISSVQVLKGPQGTYFGRNTTAGAVLVYTQQPTYDAGGYVSLAYGNYNYIETEGAVNIPLANDVLAVRLAWNTQNQHGYTKNLSIPNRDLDNLDDQSGRATILFEPTSNIKNVTVFDYTKSKSRSGSTIFAAANGGAGRVPALAQFLDCSAAAAPGFGCDPSNPTSLNDVDLMYAKQLQIGNRAQFTSIYPKTVTEVYGVSNTTTVDLDAVVIKNIFGYRRTKLLLNASTVGTEVPFVNAYNRQNVEQLTNELQFSGKLLNDKLSWLLGGFYLRGQPGGINGLGLTLFRGVLTGGVQNTTFSHDYYRDSSKAVFGQLIYDLGDIVSGLKLSAGYRHTWDKQTGCTTTNLFFSQPRITEAQCEALPDGAGGDGSSYKGGVKSNSPTWTFSLDYQATDKLFFYATARRGYRGGGFNAPQLGGIFIPFQTFGPEKVLDFEVGSKVDWTAGDVRGRFNISLYRSKVSAIQRTLNSIVPDTDGDNNPANDPSGTTLVYNGGDARIQGIDLEAAINPFPNFTLSGGASYTDPKYTSTAVPPTIAAVLASGRGAGGATTFTRTPKWTFNLNGRYGLPLGDNKGELAISADYFHSSTILFDDIVQKPYDNVNARLEWEKVMGSTVNLSFFVRNVFNTTFIASGNTAGVGTTLLTGQLNPPRMYGVQVRFDFGG